MKIFYFIWMIVQILVACHLFLPLLLYFIYLFKSKNKNTEIKVRENDYAIIVTAYSQTTLLSQVVKSILELNYSNYLVYVVADNCDISDLNFHAENVILLRPENVLASNTKSHFYAINHFKRQHSHLTIIDSDNLVDTEYLNELDKFFQNGFLAVQGVRAAKNLDSTYACLDAASDIFYRFTDRELLFELGSSAALSGSGMAFTTKLYKDCLEHLTVEGAGFDKVLQLEIQKRDLRVAFARKAVVFDEKTSKTDQLVKQRARWINTWFKYAGSGFDLVLSGIKKLSWNQFIYGIFFMRPPLFILVLLSAFFFFIDLIFYPWLSIFWIASVLSFVCMFLISLSFFKAPRKIYSALINIPLFIFYQVISLIKSKKANQISVATEHYHNTDNK